ncbi:SusC/RagA family TonB-linked outer membrane protein [Sabulibacter ruber]|uniref:SusC/RagA family TonB-linked outer membrane protein n=1 Tax=Sabulibacter ruber TaxID=2811901 RepID=UPI001A956D03|nr:SusC/RagA family TonB-linked outer membrane protein [Sabulibacter ruber]
MIKKSTKWRGWEIVLPLLLLFLVQEQVFAQRQIKGVVKDSENRQTLVGVSVVEEGNPTNGVATDLEGAFSITLKNPDGLLRFSYVGYTSKTLPVKGKSTVEVFLDANTNVLQEAVVIGYQNIERKKTTGAIASIKGKDIENTPYPTFDAMLQGRVAGVSVLSVSGEPGANNIVNIRGSSNLNPDGIRAPLYVIDNIVYDVNDIIQSYGNSNPLATINPNDIESIDVLKDASASSIYGARAANGVIIIKTKRPRGGAPQIRVSTYMGIADQPAMKPIIVGAAERRMKMDLLRVGGDYTRFSNGELSPMLTDSLNPAFNNNTDWQGLFLQRGIISNVDASIMGANDTYSYRLSFNRYTEEGVMIGYGIERITPRLFLQLNPTDRIQVTQDLFLGFTKAKHGSGDAARYPFSTWGFPSSFWQIREEEKAIYSGRYDDLRDDDRSTSLNGNTQVMVKLLPGLLFRSSLSYNFNTNSRDQFIPGVLNFGRNDAISTVYQNRRWELENYFAYDKKLGENHTFSALLGQGAEKAVGNSIYTRGNGIAIDAVKTVQGVPPGSNLSGNSSVVERSRLSYFGRLSYEFKERYILQGNWRADASSRYGKSNRWGQFPSISAGWIVSEEPFFSSLTHFLPYLKFRGSYGITGLDPGSYYAQYLTLTSDASFFTGRLGNGDFANGQTMTTYNGTTVAYPNYQNAAASTDISWERSPQYNLGVDLHLFKERVSITADFYVRDSKSMVFDVPVPATTGYTSISDNYVDVRNSGVEVVLNTNNLPPLSPLQWSTNFNIAYNKNYVTNLPGGREFTFGPPWMMRTLNVGQPLFPFLVWDVEGIYARDEDVPVNPLNGRRLSWYGGAEFGAGDPARRDINGDYIIDDLDKIPAGSPNPNVTGGMTNSFSYKGFTLDVLITFIRGRSLWNGYLSDKLQDAGTNEPYSVWGPNSGPASKLANGTYWRNPGDIAQYPGLITNRVDKYHIGQSYFVEDASFTRLKNIRLGYTVPTALASKLKMKSMRIYGLVDNVYVWSNATVPDPEAVEPNGYSSGNDYPIPKKYMMGLELTF